MTPEILSSLESNKDVETKNGLTLWFSREELTKLSITQKASLFVGFIYLTGYLITQIFVRSLGIETLPFGKAQYIESGLVFSVVTFTLIFLPFGMYDLIKRMRFTLKLPMRGIWLAFFSSINYCFVLLFFALFVTRHEAELPGKFFFDLPKLKDGFFVYLLVILGGLFVASELEKAVVAFKTDWFPQIPKDHPKMFARLEKLVINFVWFIRWFLVLFSIYFDIFILVRIDWALQTLWAMRYYALLVGMLIYMAFQTRRTLRLLQDEKLRTQTLLISGIFFVVVFYLTVTAYSYTVYRVIPNSRGGKLPVVATIFKVSSNAALIYPEIMSTNLASQTRPLFLIEQGNDYYYALTNYPVFGELSFNRIYAFKSEDILSMSCEPCVRTTNDLCICGNDLGSKETSLALR